MKHLENALRDVGAQLMAAVPPYLMRPEVQRMIASAVVAGASLVAVAPANAGDNDLFPQNSAGRLGESLGGVFGRMAGEAGTSSVQNRAVANLLSTAVEEVGRNFGRATAEQTYKANAEVPSASMPADLRDQLDAMAVRAAFSFDDLSNYRGQKGWGDPTYRAINDGFYGNVKTLEMAMRQAKAQGHNVTPWQGMLNALQSPVDSIAPNAVAGLASPMLARLQRPGGPGYQVQQRSSLSDLHRQARQRQIQVSQELPR